MTRWLMVLSLVFCCTLFASSTFSNPIPFEYRVNRDTTGAQQEPSAATFSWNRKYVGWKDWRTGIPQCWYAYSFALSGDTCPPTQPTPIPALPSTIRASFSMP
jgi:hypothetical protein